MGIAARPTIKQEDIFKKISSYEIFVKYCNNFREVDKLFKSELREDSNASCMIGYIGNDLLYTDFGEGSYRSISYVMRKFDLEYIDALIKINNDFNLGLGQNQYIKINAKENSEINTEIKKIIAPEFKERLRTIIYIKEREWIQRDVDYWSQYKIPIKLLTEYNIKSISHYWIINNKGEKMYTNNSIGFSYDYYWNNSIFLRKLYFPLAMKDYKWVSNVDNTVIQGWNKLPKEGGDILFITKSFKDIMIFKLLGYWAIAPNNEKSFIPEKVFEKLKLRWKRIILWYDNDETGIIKSTEFSKKYKIENYYNPIGSEKDPSDFVKSNNLQAFNELVKTNIYVRS
jgi:hypothetical protein